MRKSGAAPTLSTCKALFRKRAVVVAGGIHVAAKRPVEIAAELAEELAGPLGLEIVDVEFQREAGGRVLRVFIDKPGGVTLDDCEALSQRLSQRLDEVDPIQESYSLEVSSPGIERPLKKPQDYARFAGRLVHVRTYGPVDGRRNFRGELLGLEDDVVVIRLEQGEVRIPLQQVAKARLVAQF